LGEFAFLPDRATYSLDLGRAVCHEFDDIVYSVGDFAVDTGPMIRQPSREIAPFNGCKYLQEISATIGFFK
jgi:hypothetical protein